MKKTLIIILCTIFISVILLIIKNNENKKTQEIIEFIYEDDYEGFMNAISEIDNVNKFDVWLSLDYSPQTLLSIACKQGNLQMVKALLEKGADPNLKYKKDYAPLNRSLQTLKKDKYEIVKLLIESGANINDEDNPAILDLFSNISLKQYYINTNQIEKIDENTLDDEDNYNLFLYLISKGVIIPDNAIFSCIRGGNLLIIEYLIDNNYCALNQDKLNDGTTPLMYATDYNYGKVEIVLNLIENGASKYLINNNGETAYDIAEKNDNKELMEILKL